MHVTSSIEGEVQSAIGDLDQVILDPLALWERRRVDKLGGAHLPCPLLLTGIRIDGDDAGGTNNRRGGDDAESDGSASKDGDVGALCMLW